MKTHCADKRKWIQLARTSSTRQQGREPPPSAQPPTLCFVGFLLAVVTVSPIVLAPPPTLHASTLGGHLDLP